MITSSGIFKEFFSFIGLIIRLENIINNLWTNKGYISINPFFAEIYPVKGGKNSIRKDRISAEREIRGPDDITLNVIKKTQLPHFD
jgi:hypothetical protein